MSRIANNALLGGGVRVRVWIREQRKIKRRSKVLLSLCWQSWISLGGGAGREVCSGRDGRDSWAWQIMKRTRAREQSVHAHSMDRIAKSKPLLTRKILRLCTLLC